MWVPFLRPFPGNEAHILFWGAAKWGVLGGGRKVYVEKSMSFFRSPNDYRHISVILELLSQLHRPSVKHGFLAGIRLCNPGAPKWYFL